MKIFFHLGIILTVLHTILAAGCSGNGSIPLERATDNTGHDFKRIVCMSPSAVEIVFALGQGDRVVGVSDYTYYPPEADDLVRCGGHLNPNYEIILSLQPDLLIIHGDNAKLSAFAATYDIEILSLQIDNMDSIFAAIIETGKALNHEQNAQALVAGMERQLTRIQTRPTTGPPVDALLVIGRDPAGLREINVVGGGGFLHELLEAAGGRNVAEDIGRQYANINKEVLAQRAPEIIIELRGEGMMEEHQRHQYLKAWQDMASLPAVRKGQVYTLDENFILIPGPRSVNIAESMAELIDRVK